MLFRHTNILPLMGLLCACAPEIAAPTFPCTPGTDNSVTFELDYMPCVQLTIDGNDFRSLGSQTRFEGSTSDQLSGAVGHILHSCTEPFPDPFTHFPADVQIEGLSAQNIGVRKKGFVGSVLTGSERRPSLKIKPDKYVENQLLGDLVSVTLNNNLTDASRMRTCLVYSVFHDAGYPAPLCNLANVMVNDVSLGAYTHVEPIKNAFLQRAFGNDTGSLYESTISDFTPSHLADGLGRWEAKTDESIPDATLLWNVAQALEADDESLAEELGRVLDIDLFLSFWALETLVNHGDGYNSNSNNSYVYFDPDNEGRAVFIPWGPDDAMQDVEGGEFNNSAIARRLSRHPTFSNLYIAKLSDMLENVWVESRLDERILIMQAHVESAEDTPELTATVDELRGWIEGRRSAIEKIIEDGASAGEELENECVPAAIDELLGTGEVVSTASISCTAHHGSVQPFWVLFALCGLRRMQIQRRRGTCRYGGQKMQKENP